MSTERSGIKPDTGIEKDHGWLIPGQGGGTSGIKIGGALAYIPIYYNPWL